MKHAILGAGGVGGLMGACLAHLGHSVTLVLKPESLAKHPEELRLESRLGNFAVPVARATEVPPSDVLWLAVKAPQLETALSSIRKPESVRAIVPLLNGIDHMGLLQSKYGADKVIAGTFAGETERVAPGHIVHRTPFARLNLLSKGKPLLAGMVEQLQAMGFECRFIDDEPTLMWGKLVFLAPFALTTTAADKSVGEVLSDNQWRDLGIACVREVCLVAAAEGAKINVERVLAGIAAMPAPMRSSMQKDVDNGRTPELDAIAGPVLRGGERHGIELPATRRLVFGVEKRAGTSANMSVQ